MPKKKDAPMSDEERAKRIREIAREVDASDSAKEFERAFKKIVPQKRPPNDS